MEAHVEIFDGSFEVGDCFAMKLFLTAALLKKFGQYQGYKE